MNTKRFLLSTLFILVFFRPGCIIAQVAINTDGSLPDSKAILDIKSANKGVLLPRIALTGTTDNTTIPSPPTSMLIYNTATTSDVTPGYYYWNGAKWTTVSTTVTTPGGIDGSVQYNTSGNFGGNSDFTWDVASGRLKVKSAGTSNLFLGENSGNSTLTGSANMFIGNGTGASITSGYNNTFLGSLTGQYVTSAWGNTFIGSGIGAHAAATAGNLNTIAGAGASSNAAFTGRDNTLVGANAGRDLSTGLENTASGSYSGYQMQGGSRNTFFGYRTGASNISGNNNLFLGYQAGDNATGSNNIIVGYDIDAPVSGNSNQLAIGNLVFGTGIDGTGTTLSTGNIGIGLTAPASRFHSAGQISSGIPFGGLGGASAANGSMLFYNSTNTNTVTLQTGITSSSYVMTLPTAQGASSTILQNNGSGVLSWEPGVSGSGTTNFATYWSGASTIAAEQFLNVTRGGTGMGSYAIGDLVYASAASTLSRLADVATGNAFISGGVGAAPAWGKIGLTTHVSGILPIANGGTNTNATPTAGALAYGTGTAYAFTAAGTSGQVLTSNGSGTPTWAAAGAQGSGTANYASYWTNSTTIGSEQYLNVSRGGTGLGSYTTGDFIYASAAGALSKLADVATGNAIISGGVGGVPSWGKIGLTTHVSGTLPIANGGTNGTATPTAGAVAYGTGSAFAFTAAGTSGQVLTSNGSSAPTWAAAGPSGTGTANYAAYWSANNAIGAEQYLGVTRGGTGMGSYTTGDLIYASNGVTLSRFADVATGTALLSGGTNTAPIWGKVNLTSHITGILPIANGGTNSTASPTSGAVAYGTGTAYTFSAAGTSGQVLISNGTGAPSWSSTVSDPTAWKTTGNALYGATDPFLGSTDNYSLKFKANNMIAGWLDVTYGNTSFGIMALNACTPNSSPVEGSYNTAMGRSTMPYNTKGNYNTAVGTAALFYNTTASKNTAIGDWALHNLGYLFDNGGAEWESGNTAVGSSAMQYTQPTSTSEGIYNTAVGYGTLNQNHTGSYNTAIGQSAGCPAGGPNNLVNTTAIGSSASVTASNMVMVGNTSVTWIGGQVGWTALSDARWKKDVVDIPYGLDFIQKLRPVEYTLKDGNGRKDWGFLAQDIESLIGTDKNILGIGEDKDRTLSLRYTDFIAPMVKAIQQQQAMIESQQARIDAQQNQNNEIKREIDEMMKRVEALEKK
jgi:trimeric autotransporter adhesin